MVYFFKHKQKVKLIREAQKNKTKINASFPLDCTRWFVGNVVDDSIDCTFHRVGDSSADLLQNMVWNFEYLADIPSMLRTARTTMVSPYARTSP